MQSYAGICLGVFLQSTNTFCNGYFTVTMAMGNVLNYHTQPDSAVYFYKNAIPYFQKILHKTNKNIRLGQLYFNLGKAYRSFNHNEEAIKAFNTAIDFYKIINRKK